MATLGLIILATACLTVSAFPEDPLPYRNTIFGDEKLEGGVFEDIDAFNDITLYNTGDNPYRLPTTTKPEHYNVGWIVNMTTRTFSGVVNIELVATTENVNEIVLHAHDLNIQGVVLSLNDSIVHQTHTLEPQYHFLRVRLTSGFLEFNATNPALYTLTIAYDAELRKDMYGIYESWYVNYGDRTIRWMASTQFQATAARFAFPCYDEPSFKATFDITIIRPREFTSWSCTRLRESSNFTTDDDESYVADSYYTTPKMSTYLLALIVAEYESIADTRQTATNETVLSYEVIARPSAILSGQGDFSFDLGRRLLAYMSNYTNIDFYEVSDYLKMTQAAIPDFGAGAMENWGLLTYREAYLMHSDIHTNGQLEQLIGYILSHEIAHMWFGNLVTCDWWDALWLNEGFARYYQYFLTHWVAPEYDLARRFITEQVHTSLLSDSADTPQPLTNPGVGSPSSVSAMFSTISYNKGAAVIRMTEHLMGKENHDLALRYYLETRRFQTARPIDLFEDLQTVAEITGAIAEYGPDFNIIEYYKTWTEQPGHPVLNVAVNHQTGIMTVTQRRFNINSGYSTANTNWIVPITFATESDPNFENTKPTHIIRESLTQINRGTIGDEWVIFNKQQTGFYRVNYDDYTWDLITLALRGPNRTQINEYNRAQIVNDVFQFARSGIMNYTRAFNILSFLENETDYTPWVAAITGFNWIRNRIVGTPLETPINNLMLNWTTNVMRELTYYASDDESFMVSYLRYMLAPVMCNLGHSECIEAARNQFTNLTDSGIEVDADSREWVYCNGLRYGTVDEYYNLYTRFMTHPVYSEKLQILRSLGCTPHTESLNSLMSAIVLDNYEIRPQDYSTAFNAAVSGNEGNTQIVFQFIQNNFDAVREAFGSVTTPLNAVASRLRTTQQVNQFRQWAVENQELLGTSFQPVFNAAQTSLSSIEWAQTVQEDMSNYIAGDVPILELSTASPVPTTTPFTATVGPISAPTTPTLSDSANSSFLSALTVVAVILAKFIL